MTGVSDELVEECHATTILKNMDISCLIVHSQHVESNLKRKNRVSNPRSQGEKGCGSPCEIP